MTARYTLTAHCKNASHLATFSRWVQVGRLTFGRGWDPPGVVSLYSLLDGNEITLETSHFPRILSISTWNHRYQSLAKVRIMLAYENETLSRFARQFGM